MTSAQWYVMKVVVNEHTFFNDFKHDFQDIGTVTFENDDHFNDDIIIEKIKMLGIEPNEHWDIHGDNDIVYISHSGVPCYTLTRDLRWG